MVRLKIFLKCGHVLEFYCNEYEFSYNSKTLEYNGYNIKGMKSLDKKDITIGIVPSQISAYMCFK